MISEKQRGKIFNGCINRIKSKFSSRTYSLDILDVTNELKKKRESILLNLGAVHFKDKEATKNHIYNVMYKYVVRKLMVSTLPDLKSYQETLTIVLFNCDELVKIIQQHNTKYYTKIRNEWAGTGVIVTDNPATQAREGTKILCVKHHQRIIWMMSQLLKVCDGYLTHQNKYDFFADLVDCAGRYTIEVEQSNENVVQLLLAMVAVARNHIETTLRSVKNEIGDIENEILLTFLIQ
jgi:hypothetical protein